MKKFLSLVFAGLLFTSFSFAQTTIYEDDFEVYNVGDYIAESSDFWSTWSGNTGGSEDAQITEAQANSGTKSFLVEGQATDLLLLLGNKTSGIYDVNFYYYVESGFGGYYNFQKVEGAPGTEYAFEVYFGNDGSGRLVQGGDHAFTYTPGSWILIQNHVDLNTDLITVTIEGTQVYEWTYSLISDGTQGMKQLGSVDVFAGAEDGQSAKYYVDDVEYIEVEAGSNPPEISVSIAELTTDGTASETFSVTNEGTDDLVYEIFAYYPQNETKISGEVATANTVNQTVKFLESGKVDMEKPMKHIPNSKDVELTHLSGDMGSSLGWNSPLTVNVSALFKHGEISDYVGMELSSVIIFVNDAPINTEVEVYTGYEMLIPGPLNLVTTESFVAETGTQSFVALSNPVYISGEDLWIGWVLDDPGAEVFPVAMDAGPPVNDGNWTKTGPSWSELTNPEYGNFGIVGILTGEPTNAWLELNTSGGTLSAGNSDEIEVSFNLEGMSTGVYDAVIAVKSNDPDDDESSIEIPVNLDYYNSVSGLENSAIMTFPNPAKDVFNIVSDNNITNVVITNIAGQEVYNENPNSNNCKVNLNNFSKGVYIFNISTENQTITKKVVVE